MPVAGAPTWSWKNGTNGACRPPPSPAIPLRQGPPRSVMTGGKVVEGGAVSRQRRQRRSCTGKRECKRASLADGRRAIKKRSGEPSGSLSQGTASSIHLHYGEGAKANALWGVFETHRARGCGTVRPRCVQPVPPAAVRPRSMERAVCQSVTGGPVVSGGMDWAAIATIPKRNPLPART